MKAIMKIFQIIFSKFSRARGPRVLLAPWLVVFLATVSLAHCQGLKVDGSIEPGVSVSNTDPISDENGDGDGNGDGNGNNGEFVGLEAPYADFGDLLQYVQNDGDSWFEASGTGCPDSVGAGFNDQCIHAGLIRRVVFPDQDRCDGWSAHDDQGLLEWICVVQNDSDGDGVGSGIILGSIGFANGKGMRDALGRQDGQLIFPELTVTVEKDGGTEYQSDPTVFWNNPIEELTSQPTSYQAGTVYLISSDLTQIQVDQDHVAVLVDSSVTLSGSGGYQSVVLFDGVSYGWFEGSIAATGEYNGIYLNSGQFTTIRDTTISLIYDFGVNISSYHGARLHNVQVSDINDGGSSGTGLNVNGGYALKITNSSFSNNQANGATINNCEYSEFTSVSFDNNNTNGAYINNCLYDTRFDDINLQGNNGYGMMAESSDGLVLANFTVSSNAGWGLRVSSSANIALDNISTDNNDGSGLYLFGVSNSRLNSFTSTSDNLNTADAASFLVEQSADNIFENPAVINGSAAGVFATAGSSGNIWENLWVVGGVGNGVEFDISSGSPSDANEFYGLNIVAPGSGGLVIGAGLNGHKIKNARISRTGLDGISISNATRLITFQDTVVDNAGRYGAYLNGAAENLFQNLTIANTTNSGLLVDGGGNNMFLNVTVANTGAQGVYLGSTTTTLNNVFMNVMAINTISDGLELANADYNTFMNTLVTHTNEDGISIINASAYNYFTGNLKVENVNYGSGGVRCDMTSTGTAPGLNNNECADGGTSGSSTYSASGSNSDAVFDTGYSGIGILVGTVTTDDIHNANDSSGTALFDDIQPQSWVSFDNGYRLWAPYNSGAAFPEINYSGVCSSGNDCQILDFSLSTSDSLSLWANSVPADGNAANTLTVTWNATPVDQTDCDNLIPGSLYNSGGGTCESTFLRGAVEILGDEGSPAPGNENGLCESNEYCLFTGHIGAYQGHGSLEGVSGGFTDGDTLSGIILDQFTDNGR